MVMSFFSLILQLLLHCVFQICIVNSMNVTVLHTNDLHGRFEEINQYGYLCDVVAQKEKRCYGGVARLATAVKQVNTAEENVIFLDGGDRFAGTIWTEVYRGNATRTFVNKLNYTAVTLGNHDFDYGIPALINFLEGTKVSVVVSNINTSRELLWPDDKQLIKQTKVVDLHGHKIGIVGYIIESTGETSSASDIQFLPIVKSVQKAVRDLESRGITKIIAVGHAGFDVDKEIARKVKGVDIVVGGHSNTFLYTGIPPSTEKPKGSYPYIIHPNHNKTLSIPVVQAFAYGKYLGHLQVTFNDQGEITSWHGNPILLDHKIRKDIGVDNIVKKMKVLVDKNGEVKIGQSKMKLDASNNVCANQPCSLGKVVTAAMVYHFRSKNASIALITGASIRMSLPTDTEGNVLYKNLFLSFPYRSTIDLIDLSGADLLKSLEVSSFMQMTGLRVQYSIHSSTVRHVKMVEVQNTQCSSTNCYHPINRTKKYKVVVTSYLATTGNKVYIEKARNRIRGDSIYDVIVEYFNANSPITVGLNTDVNTGRKLVQSRNILFFVMIAWSLNITIFYNIY